MKTKLLFTLAGLGILLVALSVIIITFVQVPQSIIGGTSYTEATLVSSDENGATYSFTWVTNTENRIDCADPKLGEYISFEAPSHPQTQSALPENLEGLKYNERFMVDSVSISPPITVRSNAPCNPINIVTYTPQIEDDGTECWALDLDDYTDIRCDFKIKISAINENGREVPAVFSYAQVLNAIVTIPMENGGEDPIITDPDFPLKEVIVYVATGIIALFVLGIVFLIIRRK